MSDMVHAAIAPDAVRFSIGRALALSFGVLGRNFGPKALLSLAIFTVEAAIGYVMAGIADGTGSSALGLVSYAFITAPVTYATFQDLRGTRASTKALGAHGFNRAGRVLAVAFAFSVVIVVPVVVVVGISSLFFGWSLAVPFATAGIFALYIFVLWFVVVPVQVVEETKFFRGFSRAAELGRGRRWAILGLVLIYCVLTAAIIFVMLMITYLISDSDLFLTMLPVPFSALYSVFGAILPAVVYYLLRAEKEGVGIDQIARVFD